MLTHYGSYSIIHSATSANLTAFTYSQIYAGSAGSATINGTDVTLAAGTLLDIKIGSITGVTGSLYVLGEKINVYAADPNLGSIIL